MKVTSQIRFGFFSTCSAILAIFIGAVFLISPFWQPGCSLYNDPLPQPQENVPVEQEPVNVNTADVSELTRLPGIGEAKAKAIIEYRAEHGPFASLADLEKVSGISARMVESWKNLAVTQ